MMSYLLDVLLTVELSEWHEGLTVQNKAVKFH